MNKIQSIVFEQHGMPPSGLIIHWEDTGKPEVIILMFMASYTELNDCD